LTLSKLPVGRDRSSRIGSRIRQLGLDSNVNMLSIPGKALLLLSTLAIPLVQTGFVSSLPQCIQDCIDQSQDDNCSVTDVACLCRASAGNFLPDLITCMHGNCDNDLDNDLLLTPLQIVCEIAGAPIPESAIRNAENQASSLDTQATTTVTVGGSSATGGGGSEATTTVSMTVMKSSVSTKTVTKTKDGSTIYVVYPITVGSTTTVSGKPSTVTSISKSTGRSPSETASDSVSSTTTFTTSVQAAEMSSSGSPSSRTSTRKPEVTNSSPFTTTNNNGASKGRVGSLLGFSVFLMACCFWY